MGYISGIQHPEFFQGNGMHKNYFEGWYFKYEFGDSVFALIPGISLFDRDQHAFIQLIINGSHTDTYYLRYPLSDFFASPDALLIKIGKNIFSQKGIDIDLRDRGVDFACHIGHGCLTPFKKSLLRPGIMGIFSYTPLMECNHAVVSLEHKVGGWIRYFSILQHIENGIGYIEKDWGRSFPSSYLWVQCNNFDKKGISFMLSSAVIPYLGMQFPGLICILKIGKKQRVFATYNFARITSIRREKGYISIEVRKGHDRLLIRVESISGGTLAAPLKGGMDRRVKECIHSKMELTFQSGGKTWKASGKSAGFEFSPATKQKEK